MSEAFKGREKAARKEYPETKAAFDRVRAAAVETMFATLPSQPEKREELYRLVHILENLSDLKRGVEGLYRRFWAAALGIIALLISACGGLIYLILTKVP